MKQFMFPALCFITYSFFFSLPNLIKILVYRSEKNAFFPASELWPHQNQLWSQLSRQKLLQRPNFLTPLVYRRRIGVSIEQIDDDVRQKIPLLLRDAHTGDHLWNLTLGWLVGWLGFWWFWPAPRINFTSPQKSNKMSGRWKFNSSSCRFRPHC